MGKINRNQNPEELGNENDGLKNQVADLEAKLETAADYIRRIQIYNKKFNGPHAVPLDLIEDQVKEIQAAEKAKDQETAAKIEAYRKNADLLERVKKAEAENADLRLRLAAARAILRDALSDLGE